jgi:hypothetical protein
MRFISTESRFRVVGVDSPLAPTPLRGFALSRLLLEERLLVDEWLLVDESLLVEELLLVFRDVPNP